MTSEFSNPVPDLDRWLASLFDPKNLDATCQALATAPDTDRAAIAEAAQRTISDYNNRLASYRRALESGTPGDIMAEWIKEVTTRRVDELPDVTEAIASANPDHKAQLYAEL